MKPAMARVLDSRGRELSPCPVDRAWQMISDGKAELLADNPLIVRLMRPVELPPRVQEVSIDRETGRRLLLHICCSPCSTYPVRWLRDNGYDVTGLWYNPNVHPFGEHELRRASLERYAGQIGLDVVWTEGYDMPRFLRLIAGRERFRERCRLCYQLRLERTAEAASQHGYDAFTTSLLISVHQDQAAIREIGEEAGRRFGIRFLFENFRRGWAERGRTASQYGLYQQQYCGCVYSEWERYDRRAKAASSQE